MPVGRLSLRHALIGGVVYGSPTTAIAVLLSLEIGAMLLLFGAQVISEYERLGRADGARLAGLLAL